MISCFIDDDRIHEMSVLGFKFCFTNFEMIMSARCLMQVLCERLCMIAISRFRVIMYALAVGGAANVDSSKRTHSHARIHLHTTLYVYIYIYMRIDR